MSAIYDGGLASFLAGSTAVSGVGTDWVANVQPGDTLIGPDGRSYGIAAVVSAASLTLDRAYRGRSIAAVPYAAVRVQIDEDLSTMAGVAQATFDARDASLQARDTALTTATPYASRAAFQAATVAATVLLWSIAGAFGPLKFRRDAAGTAVTSANGVKGSPDGEAQPEHFGALGTGAVASQDHPALVSWAAWGGPLRARPGQVFGATARTANIDFPAGCRADLMGSTYRQDYTDTSANNRLVIRAGARVRDITMSLSGSNYFRRSIYMEASARLSAFAVAAATPFASAALVDNLDGAIRLAGADCVIEDGVLDGIYQPQIMALSSSPRALIRRLRLRNFAKGIVLGALMPGAIVEDIDIDSLHPSGLSEAGYNIITEVGPHTRIRRIRQTFDGRAAWEHAIYLSALDGTRDVGIEEVALRGVGQCAVKVRGVNGLYLSGIDVMGVSWGTSFNTNKDYTRLEYCRGVRARGMSGRRHPDRTTEGAQDGLHLLNAWDHEYSDISIHQPNRAFIWMSNHTSGSWSSSPNDACEDIHIKGLEALRKGTGATKLLRFGSDQGLTSVRIGDVIAEGIEWDGGLTAGDLIHRDVTVNRVTGSRVYLEGTSGLTRFSVDWPAADTDPTLRTYDKTIYI